MYNDEKNLYHYTYRKDGSESAHDPQVEAPPSVGDQLRAFQSQNGPQQPIQEMKPVKKNRMGLKITALALCCALLGGAVGGGVAWGVSRSGSGTSINVSSRPATTVSINKVDGKTEMSDAEVYAATVNSVVSIRTSATSGTNFFGQAVETASAGSGFVLTADGYIVTNYHVVKDADTVTVTMYNGDEYNALYVGGDEDYDIAVIKVEATGLQAVTLATAAR
jgi:serine protease Do